MPNTLLNEK